MITAIAYVLDTKWHLGLHFTFILTVIQDLALATYLEKVRK